MTFIQLSNYKSVLLTECLHLGLAEGVQQVAPRPLALLHGGVAGAARAAGGRGGQQLDTHLATQLDVIPGTAHSLCSTGDTSQANTLSTLGTYP